jgi:hypothetical protein
MSNNENPAEPPYLYDAFISYRHVERDGKWAQWLIGALERYRVPKELQARGFPPKLRKIFRDEDEVPASGDLNDQIRQALLVSRFLIVVCSPYTPRSIWVQREIKMFNELGRSDNVLALLTEGEPSDSFPTAMLERPEQVVDSDGTTRIIKEAKEPLAADVRRRPGISMERQRRTALLRLVAVILGVKYDDLYQRERQRERTKKLTWAAAAAGLILAIGIGGFTYWEMNRPKFAYYRDLVFRWETPEGLDPIDEQTRQHLHASYRVTTRDGKVIEVRHENSAGSLVPDTAINTAKWVVRYRKDGSLESVEFIDASDRLTYEERYERDPTTNHLIVNLRHGITPATQEAVVKSMSPDISSGSLKGNTEITRHEITFDNDGFATARRYQDYFGAPRQNAEGSFGQAYKISSAGLLTRAGDLGPDGAEITLKTGISSATTSYDRSNRRVKRTTIGSDGKPVAGQDGIAVEIWEYGSDGNLAVSSYLGADGKPAARGGACVKDQLTYDDHGNLVAQSCIGADSKPTLFKDGYAKVIFRYDDHGYQTETAYLGADGKLISGPDGCPRVTRAFDAHRLSTQQDCFYADGNPGPRKSGHARARHIFDQHGNRIESSYFAADGKQTLSMPNNCAKMTSEFDSQDNRKIWSCYGVDGKPKLNSQGIFKLAYSYDTRGNLVAESYFGEDSKPTLANGCGCASYQQTFDRNGNQIEVKFVGIDGRPLAGIDRTVYRYDENGNPTELSNFGVDGKLILNKDGYARATAEYDSRGNATQMAFFGADGMPTALPIGYASVRAAFDARGKEIMRAYFGVDGKPVALPQGGFARYTSTYDARGNLIEQAVFDKDNKPTLNASGFAMKRQIFDDRRNPIETAYYGTDNKLIITKDGYAVLKQTFDDRNQETESAFFGVDHRPLAIAGIARLTSEFDARGNLIEYAAFGLDGKSASFPSGMARITWKFDDWGQQTEAHYVDPAGHEVAGHVIISRIFPGTVAEQINLAAGDRIVSYGGRKMTSTRQMIDATTDPRLGNKRVLNIARGSQNFTFEVPSGRLGIAPELALDKP